MFSKGQSKYINYLLRRIGFNDNYLIDEYLRYLWHRHRHQISENSTLKISPAEFCIDYIKKEVEFRYYLEQIRLKKLIESNIITSTDLSNFVFCSASYSISKSFHIDQPIELFWISKGIDLHKTLRFIKRESPIVYSESDISSLNARQREKIERIRNCELIFAGHKSDQQYYINQSVNWKGQPDYIFRDPLHRFFVVEEKFRYCFRESDNFGIIFKNHCVQLQSYINYIQEYNIEYGILIYWYYDFYYKEQIPNIHALSIKVFKKNSFTNLLRNTHDAISQFHVKKVSRFSFNGSTLNKCTACSVNWYCAHKTVNEEYVRLPYDIASLKLKDVNYDRETDIPF